MELKLHRPHTSCAETGRAFIAGEPLVSALVRAEGRLDRCDYAADAWSGPPPNTLAWWRSTYPAAAASGAALAPADVLLDALEEMEGQQADEALRYLVALELVRRRVLRFVDRPHDEAGGRAAGDGAEGDGRPQEFIVACRKRDREYRVRSISPQEAAAPGLEARLMQLFWSGGAA